MSSNLALSVRGLSKEYRIAHQAERATTMGEALVHRLKNPFSRPTFETFQALKDVSFNVEKGEVVGIIGRNGAGKSTLLKILSKITEPTSGEIRLYGRVGSLLEVGTGFHPELTGRENIFLNGAILGMRRKEIERQFDAIVDFAEVEKFLDTPVKRYSSGMYVRLAFAVAAHLNPEILIVDEVLAVGDAQFQKKCLGKMQDVSRQEGRTVLFVSHNMGAVSTLCHRAVLLERGSIKIVDSTSKALEEYARLQQASVDRKSRIQNNDRPRFGSVACSKDVFRPDEEKAFQLTVLPSSSELQPIFVSGEIRNRTNEVVSHFDSRLREGWFRADQENHVEVSFSTPWLRPDDYTVTLFVCKEGEVLDEFPDALAFSVSADLPYEGVVDVGALRYSSVLTDFQVKKVGTPAPVNLASGV